MTPRDVDRPTRHPTAPVRVPLVLPFPTPGSELANTYRELAKANDGNPHDLKAIGDLDTLPRPWDPGSVTTPAHRAELWAWLEEVVTWVNTEYVWQATTMIPPCWPLHPHLVHEIAVLADRRHHAGQEFTSTLLDEWHRQTLPLFLDRMATRTRNICEETHQPWPAKSRHARHLAENPRRQQAYRADRDTCVDPSTPDGPPRLQVIDGHTVDETTGQVHD